LAESFVPKRELGNEKEVMTANRIAGLLIIGAAVVMVLFFVRLIVALIFKETDDPGLFWRVITYVAISLFAAFALLTYFGNAVSFVLAIFG